MGSQMNVNEQKMLDYYEKLMDQVYLRYHTHPTHIKPMGEHSGEGEGYAKDPGYASSGVYRNGVRYSGGVPDRIANRKP